ncbi:MAG: class I mannose-6-phosphate isomerase [Silvibacterium sp.]
MSGFHNYDLNPVIHMPAFGERDCLEGWNEVMAHIKECLPVTGRYSIGIECYPGVMLDALEKKIASAFPQCTILNVEDAYKDAAVLRDQFQETLTTDPVFGKMRQWPIASYFDEHRVAALKAKIEQKDGMVVLIGAGTPEVLANPDLLVHANVTRWELQKRQRSKSICNLGVQNYEDSAQLLYKNAYFLEWRVADEVRHVLYERVDYFLDLDDEEAPRMVRGDVLRAAVATVVKRPFRVRPFFDPGPWGGHWMMQTFDLPQDVPNYAWCFDCVPEENSVALGFGSRRFQLPAIVLVHEQPIALLGEAIYRHFGAEFPIRFDLLDTVGGSNLSLQVHPLREYIRQHFGISYTQDESYYILDQSGDSQVYLGVRTGAIRDEMRRDLEDAQAGGPAFPAECYVNLWPARKHDHFSIPAGTIHCSGRDNLVLEISATPYIFTFKLWDWGRLGLDGSPRPIHLEHGLANIQWNRDTEWVRRELLNQTELVSTGDGWREERTGLHHTQFLETRRTWFTKAVTHNTNGNLHVLNLVEGEAVSVESPSDEFPPVEVHYAETFIVPASVGAYTIRPLGKTNQPLATIRAYLCNSD